MKKEYSIKDSPDLITGVSALIAAVSAIALVGSIIHEQAYFLVIGSIWRTHLVISDYFTLAALWLPLTISSVIVGAITALFLAKEDDNFDYNVPADLEDDELLKRLDLHKEHAKQEVIKATSRMMRTAWFIFIIGVLLLIGTIISQPPLYIIPVSFWALSSLLRLLSSHTQKKNGVSQSTQLLGLLAIAVMALSIISFAGIAEGYGLLAGKEGTYNLKLINSDELDDIYVARKLQAGLLLFDIDSRSFSFVPSDQVRQLKRNEVEIVPIPYGCKFLQLLPYKTGGVSFCKGTKSKSESRFAHGQT